MTVYQEIASQIKEGVLRIKHSNAGEVRVYKQDVNGEPYLKVVSRLLCEKEGEKLWAVFTAMVHVQSGTVSVKTGKHDHLNILLLQNHENSVKLASKQELEKALNVILPLLLNTENHKITEALIQALEKLGSEKVPQDKTNAAALKL